MQTNGSMFKILGSQKLFEVMASVFGSIIAYYLLWDPK